MKGLRRYLALGLCACLTASALAFDHKGLSLILQDYVKDGKVDYAGLKASRLKDLKGYVESLGSVRPDDLPHRERVAFWLNAYNAIVILQICQGGTPATAGSRSQFFRNSNHLVAGELRSLDDIEHRALRPLAKDPRVHFVLVCGANSCPPLKAEAFVGSADLEASLEAAAQSYINDPNNVQVDLAKRTLTLNKIFDWYQDDFGDLVPFVARYRPEREDLLKGQWTVQFRDYDWSVNQAP